SPRRFFWRGPFETYWNTFVIAFESCRLRAHRTRLRPRHHPAPLVRPIRPGIAANSPTLGANEARSERRHEYIVAVAVYIEHSLVVAFPAGHVQPLHTVFAHVAKRHGRAGVMGM